MKDLSMDKMQTLNGGMSCSGAAGLSTGLAISMLGLAALATPLAMGAGLVLLYSGGANAFYQCVVKQ